MKSVWRAFVVTVFGLSLAAEFAIGQQAHDKQSRQFAKVTIAGSEVRPLKSASTGREYNLYVHLPADYDKSGAKKYPVLYVLDGQWDFKLMDSVLGGLVYDKFVPDIILVGIGYAGENADYNALRAMDLTPSAVATVKGSGDAPKFFNFVKSEAIPFVESNYRADPSRRFLQGSSYAGLFTLYTMLREPDLFAGYVAASPAVSFDNGYVFKQEAEYARTHKELKTRLYLSVADSEGLTEPVKQFMATMKARAYQGLKLETRIIDGERHAGNKPESFNRGLRFLFSE